MNFIISMALGTLDLTEQEQAAVEAALPDLKAVVDSLDAAMPDIRTINQLWVQNQTLVLRFFTDIDKIGPAASALLGDGWVDLPSVMSAVTDIKNAINADPNTVNAVEALYNKLLPVGVGIYQKWPSIRPAYAAIMAALARKHTTLPQMIAKMTSQS